MPFLAPTGVQGAASGSGASVRIESDLFKSLLKNKKRSNLIYFTKQWYDFLTIYFVIIKLTKMLSYAWKLTIWLSTQFFLLLLGLGLYLRYRKETKDFEAKVNSALIRPLTTELSIVTRF